MKSFQPTAALVVLALLPACVASTADDPTAEENALAKDRHLVSAHDRYAIEPTAAPTTTAPAPTPSSTTTTPPAPTTTTPPPAPTTTTPPPAPTTTATTPPTSTTPPTNTPPPAPAGEVAIEGEVAHVLSILRSSSYQHTTYVDEATGTFDVDCSGFLNYVLSNSIPDVFSTVVAHSSSRPLAADYEAIFAAATASGAIGRVHGVARAIDLAPGDLIAWLEVAGSGSSNTGHSMIVHGTPSMSTKRSDEVLVQVTDSANSGHYDDTRPSGATGVGTGTIGLLVDSAGRPIGYRWHADDPVSSDNFTTVSMAHIE